MDHVHKLSLALIVELISGLDAAIMDDIKRIRDERERFILIFVGAYFMISCMISSRWNEGLMLDLTRKGEKAKSQKKHMTMHL